MPHVLLERLATFSLDPEAEPASDAAIRAFEQELGAPLPPAYRELLGAGDLPVGLSDPAPISLADGGTAQIETLFGLGCDRHRDLHHQTFDVYPGRIPDETIPIGEANEGNGDLLLLAVSGPRTGEVFVWLHDHPEISAEQLTKMTDELLAEGRNLEQMDQAAIIHAWEHAHASELGRKPLWGNVLPVAESITELLQRSRSAAA